MPEKVDAVVLIDGSNSVNAANPGNFRKSLQFIINLADKLDIGECVLKDDLLIDYQNIVPPSLLVPKPFIFYEVIPI